MPITEIMVIAKVKINLTNGYLDHINTLGVSKIRWVREKSKLYLSTEDGIKWEITKIMNVKAKIKKK